MALLHGNGWLTARAILATSCAEARSWNDRLLREFAHHSQGQIIAGQRGYKLTASATEDEAAHACAWLRHQAAKMSDRALAIELFAQRTSRARDATTSTNKPLPAHQLANAAGAL